MAANTPVFWCSAERSGITLPASHRACSSASSGVALWNSNRVPFVNSIGGRGMREDEDGNPERRLLSPPPTPIWIVRGDNDQPMNVLLFPRLQDWQSV